VEVPAVLIGALIGAQKSSLTDCRGSSLALLRCFSPDCAEARWGRTELQFGDTCEESDVNPNGNLRESWDATGVSIAGCNSATGHLS